MLLVIASLTKRAQLPFSAWLPLAMAAPTPVRALVHSSTLVTAGVYLLLRCSRFILFEGPIKPWILILCASTAILAALAANIEVDIKKLIALSTLRNLGLICFSVLAGSPDVAFFHLVIHALSKALLFLCAGIIIHIASGTQDIRVLGPVGQTYPFLLTITNIRRISLGGFPCLRVYSSKHMVLQLACGSTMDLVVLTIVVLCVFFRVCYTTRLLRCINSGVASFILLDKRVYSCYTLPITILRLFAITLG